MRSGEPGQAGRVRAGSCQAVGDSVLYSRTWWATPVRVFKTSLSLEYGQVLREEYGLPWWLRR